MDATADVLQRWSLGVQFGTVTLIAIFFVLLARWVRLDEVRVWASAWVANAFSLAAGFTMVAGDLGPFAMPVALASYTAGKTMYALLMVRGAEYHIQPGARGGLRPRHVPLIAAVWGITIAIVSPHPLFALPFQWLLVGVVLVVGAWRVVSHPRTAGSPWLGWVLLAEGLLFLHYVPLLMPLLVGERTLPSYLNVSSFFDAGAELLLALASLVALESSSSEHLRALNLRLVASQEQLRQLVDHDVLTGLMNRRRLREAFAHVHATGATLIFLDIDNFKAINDRSGHEVGDQSLQALSRLLQQTFRTDDAIFRWGGDEFLVIAAGLDVDQARQRVERLRTQLRTVPAIPDDFSISVGVVAVPPGGEPEVALREADAAMYDDKRSRTRLTSRASSS